MDAQQKSAMLSNILDVVAISTSDDITAAMAKHKPGKVAEIISQRVADGRLACGMTQMQLAVEVGISAQHLSSIETHRLTPSAETIVALCMALGVSADYLLGLSDPRAYTDSDSPTSHEWWEQDYARAL